MTSCEKHLTRGTCPTCETEERKALLAHRLALFLGVNEVENYVSPGGYRLKKVTIRQPGEEIWKLWAQGSKEEEA